MLTPSPNSTQIYSYIFFYISILLWNMIIVNGLLHVIWCLESNFIFYYAYRIEVSLKCTHYFEGALVVLLLGPRV